MGEIINMSEFRLHSEEPSPELYLKSASDTQRIEAIRDQIEQMLEHFARTEDLPLTVAMSAGRYAAMRMFQLQGRAETMAFIEQCITTAELCDDIARQLDDDA